jgi:hypothetical protein
MLDAVREGATDPSIEGVDVVVRPALTATSVDALAADPANLGYLSGALKHFFDQIYYPCIDATRGRSYGLFVHGNNDTTGAVRGVETIVAGLQWRLAQPVLSVIGEPTSTDREACWELGASLAALLASQD